MTGLWCISCVNVMCVGLALAFHLIGLGCISCVNVMSVGLALAFHVLGNNLDSRYRETCPYILKMITNSRICTKQIPSLLKGNRTGARDFPY